jgi:CHAT domain-containing protein
VDEATLEIVSVVDSANDVSDAKALPDLLQDAPVEIEQVSADGAYDQRGCYGTHNKHGAKAAIPPRKGGKIWRHANSKAERHVRDVLVVLVLSLVDERGRPQDGFMQAHEVYNLKLNADLAPLSGRRTALGKDVKGGGLVGLTRGFMYAGAPRVVASLWQVSDKATADLMKQFYKGMLADGPRPAAALRAAQAPMWKEKRAPYFWAAFALQGE